MRKEITEDHIAEITQAIPSAEKTDRLRVEVERVRAERRERSARYKVSYYDALIARLDKEPQP